MSNILNKDMCRCYGYMCGQKEQCKRFLTLAIDAYMDELQGPSLRSYASALTDTLSEEDCTSFIQGE